MKSEKPDGWYLDMLPIGPPRIAGGERLPTIVIFLVTALITVLIAPRLPGIFELVAFAAGVILIIVETGFVRWAWRQDNRLSVTSARFRAFPSFIPAHALSSSPDGLRRLERRRRHIKR